MQNPLKICLFPLSLLYGFIIFCRNVFYDSHVFPSVKFQIPVISIGNITVGGTGKTPHAEYVIRLLKDDFRVAYLSRGYKRKTTGFVLAGKDASAKLIGDEPYQIRRKFPDVLVAVDNNRVHGIHQLLNQVPDLDIVILDDAFQHRSVTPGLNILLIDAGKPIHTDYMLPYGLLRESASEKKRADLIICTKIPENFSEQDQQLIDKHIKVAPHQQLFFTRIQYGQPIPVFAQSNVTKHRTFNQRGVQVVLVAGIANPTPLVKKLSETYETVIPMIYPDHYSYSQQDLDHIFSRFQHMNGDEKAILTTEKDASRLADFYSTIKMPEAWFYIPIEITFLPDQSNTFNNYIFNYVNNYSRNSFLH